MKPNTVASLSPTLLATSSAITPQRRAVYAVSGTMCILVGIPLYPLPLPFGLPLMTLGLALWMRSSDRFRDRVFRWAEDKPRIQKVLAKVGPKHHVPAPPAAAASHEPATAGGV